MYPPFLKLISDPPKKLFCIVNIELMHTTCIATVGARKCTEYGKNVALSLGRRLGEKPKRQKDVYKRQLYNDVIKIMNTGKYTRDLLDNFVPEDNLTGFMDIDMVVIFQKDGITKEFTFYDNKNVKIKDSLERYYRVDDDIYSKLLEYYKNINKNTAS